MDNHCLVYSVEGHQKESIHKNEASYLIRKQKAILLSDEPMTIEFVPKSIQFSSKTDYQLYSEERRVTFCSHRNEKDHFSFEGDKMMNQVNLYQLSKTAMYYHINFVEYLLIKCPRMVYFTTKCFLMEHDCSYSGFFKQPEQAIYLGSFLKTMEFKGKEAAIEFLKEQEQPIDEYETFLKECFGLEGDETVEEMADWLLKDWASGGVLEEGDPCYDEYVLAGS